MNKLKRWLFFVGALIVLAISVYLNIQYIDFQDTQHVLRFAILIAALVLLFSTIYITFNYQANQKVRTLQNRLSMWTKLSYHVSQVGDEVFNELPIGILALDDEYEIKWANPHAKVIFDTRITGRSLRDVHAQLYQAAINAKTNLTIQIKNEFYDVNYRQEYNFFYLFNVTDREKVREKYQNQIPALAIIYLDNLDEALSSMDVFEQSSLKGEYLAVIADWISKYKGYLKSYDDERLMANLYREQLNKMLEDKFDVLERVREISTRHQVRVSLSVGIASWDISYEELGVYAQNAVELAEKRGGDQVVVNIQNQKITYFGAKNDATAKNSRVGTRINAQTIRDFIDKASNVYVMGHNQTDMDAFGSSIAVYHMAKLSNKPAFIVNDFDKLDQTVQKIYQKIENEFPELLDYFITSSQALEDITADSLLIVVDSQSPRVVMNQNLLGKASQVIVIDHHRASEEGFDATFSFVEPSASSAIELIIELLTFYKMEEDLKVSPFEASVMYGGLVVDTNNFTYRTSARTFEVASILKDLGADTFEVKTWLRKDLDRTLKISQMIAKVEIFLDRFAFVVTDEINDDRILLAQVADATLQINGVDASFTISRTAENRVGVSARSSQAINVQLLMEYLGGGGHLTGAAAQIENETVEEVYEKLKSYLELEYGRGGENVKIILLEDVKGKGKKDEVIEVANGYGQFLVTQKKAVLATDENLESLKKAQDEAEAEYERHLELMRKLKSEIDGKKISVPIQIGQDGKLFGSVTTKQIVEAFANEHGVLLDKKKVDLASEINSVGIYTASVTLHKDVKAQFEINVVEK